MPTDKLKVSTDFNFINRFSNNIPVVSYGSMTKLAWGAFRNISLDEVKKVYQKHGNEMGFVYSLATSIDAFGTGPKIPDKFRRNGVPKGEMEGWYLDIVCRELTDWIAAKRDEEKPFFLIISTNEPPTPIDSTKKITRPYDTNEVGATTQQIGSAA